MTGTRKLVVATMLVCLYLSAQAQTCTDCRYLAEIFNEVDTTTVHYGAGENAEGNWQELYMDVYEPVGDTETDRPVMVFAFGGGFLQGDRFEKHVTKTCIRFAKAGYVTVAMDYRYGIDFIGGLSAPNKEAMRVFFRPMQDMRAVVQYMKYSVDSLNNQFGIDPDKIFVGGASSGGITALNFAYANTSAELLDIADTNAIDQLGGFNATSANGPHENYDWDVIGAISIAGALPSLDWIDPGEVPMILAHGDEDDTVPYEDENTLNDALQFASIQLQGSSLVNQDALSKGVCSYLYTMVGEDHPSNSRPEIYFENIYHRMMPRMYAIMNGLDYCSGLSVDIAGDSVRQVTSFQDTLELNAVVTGDQGNATVKWCSQPCVFSSTQSIVMVNPQPDPWQFYLVNAIEGSNFATDYLPVEKVDSIPQDSLPSLVSSVTQVDLQVYPNPAHDQIHISTQHQFVDVQLIDLAGKQLMLFNTWPVQKPIDVSQLAPGMYILNLQHANVTHRQVILIE